MAAPSYIKFGTTQCTDIKATSFEAPGTVDMNYVYYSTNGTTYNCVYKRTDPSNFIAGEVSAYLTKNRSSKNIVSSVDSMSISGTYQYRSRWATNTTVAPDTTVYATTSYNKNPDYVNINLQNAYYTPCGDYGAAPSSAITWYRYTITGTFTINDPYYSPNTYNSSRVHGNVTITSTGTSSDNNWQNNRMSISFKWTDAYYGSTQYNSLHFESDGVRISRDITLSYSTPTYVTASLQLINVYGNTVLTSSFSGTKTWTCVKTDLIAQFLIQWSKSTVGSTQYVHYKTFSVSSSNSISYSDYYTDSNSSRTACNFGATGNDINCSLSNLVTFVDYTYLSLTFVSGNSYRITNNDKVAHNVYYNSKKCNQSDAKNWTGLSDIKSTTVYADGRTTVTINSNWFADSETCSFTTSSYRYITYRYDSYSSSSYNTNRKSI